MLSSAPVLGQLLYGHGCRVGPHSIGVVLAGMFGLPRPWYFPFQKSYWLGNGRVETWEWTWPWSRTTRLSIMEEDQACAMESRRLGKGRQRQWEVVRGWPWLCCSVLHGRLCVPCALVGGASWARCCCWSGSGRGEAGEKQRERGHGPAQPLWDGGGEVHPLGSPPASPAFLPPPGSSPSFSHGRGDTGR